MKPFQVPAYSIGGLIVGRLLEGYLDTCDSTISAEEAQKVRSLENAAKIFADRAAELFTAQQVYDVVSGIGPLLVEAIVQYAYAMDGDPDEDVDMCFFEYHMVNPNVLLESYIYEEYGEELQPWQLVSPGFFQELASIDLENAPQFGWACRVDYELRKIHGSLPF